MTLTGSPSNYVFIFQRPMSARPLRARTVAHVMMAQTNLLVFVQMDTRVIPVVQVMYLALFFNQLQIDTDIKKLKLNNIYNRSR